MTLLEFLFLLLIAGLAGALGQALAGYERGGCLVSIALGFIGALLGTWIARTLELPLMLTIDLGDARFPLVWAVLGSALFVALLGLLQRRRRR